MRSDPGLIRSKAFAAAIALTESSAARQLRDSAFGRPDRGGHPRGQAVGDGDDDPILRLRDRARERNPHLQGQDLSVHADRLAQRPRRHCDDQASGEVYKLSDVSQFPGAWIQGNGNLAISTLANGELWLQNNHGVVMRLNAQQAGITLSNGRYEIFIHMGQ